MRVKFIRPWRYIAEGETREIPDGQANLLIARGFCKEVDAVESAELRHESTKAVMPRPEPKRAKV